QQRHRQRHVWRDPEGLIMANRPVKPDDDAKPPVDDDATLFADMESIMARCKARIEREADTLYAGTPGVPRGVCRQLITKGNPCFCLVVGTIIEAKEKAD